jgi:hypothetical protein
VLADSVYSMYLYEYTVKPVDIVLRRGREKNGGVNLTKVHPKHVWKCHSETLLCK